MRDTLTIHVSRTICSEITESQYPGEGIVDRFTDGARVMRRTYYDSYRNTRSMGTMGAPSPLRRRSSTRESDVGSLVWLARSDPPACQRHGGRNPPRRGVRGWTDCLWGTRSGGSAW